nr:uncharacterized mitochondrial protein AtMg00810-like [Tanacetum cinerariifolium]
MSLYLMSPPFPLIQDAVPLFSVLSRHFVSFIFCYACSDSLLLTTLCCEDIHDVTPRVFALVGCGKLVFRAKYLQHEHYALWEVIEFGDSYVLPTNDTTTVSASEGTATKKRRTVALTTEDMQKRRNDVKARTTLLLALPEEHQLRFSTYKTAQELWAAILKTFGEWLMHTIVWRNKSDLDTMSLDDLYNHLKVYEHEVQKKSDSHNMSFISSSKNNSGNEEDNTASVSTTSTQVSTAGATVAPASISLDTACAYITSQSNGSQIKYEDINQINKDDIEEMDIKWNMALLSMRADKYGKKTGKKLSIQGSAGLPGVKTGDRETTTDKEENHALVADEEALTEFALMAKTSADSEVQGRLVEFKNQEIKFCEKIRVLEFNIEGKTNRIEYLTKELKNLKNEKEGLESKLIGFKSATKDLDHLIGSQRSDKIKEGLGYNVVPPPPAQVYSPPKKDISSSASENEESTGGILSKPEIKFLRPADTPTVVKTDKVETSKKPTVNNAEQYKKPSKTSNVRGSQRNWNNLKSQQWKFSTGNTKFSTADMGNKGKAVKASACWFWKPSQNLSNKGNISYLFDYEPFDGGYVSFGQGGCKITECIVLGQNFKLTDDANMLLRTPRQHNMYTIDLNNIVPHKDLTCLVAKASADESIKMEFSNARSPQQNGVAERRNMTLIEAARTMVLVNKSQNKTPYELFNGRSSAIGFFKPFGYHVVILNTLDNLGKFEAKGDEGTKEAAGQDVKNDVSSLRYIILPNWFHEVHLESSTSNAQDTCSVDAPKSSGISNSTATSTNPPVDHMETLAVETLIPTVSSPVPTACLNDSPEPSSDIRLISKRVTSEDDTPSLDNILTLTNKFENILGVTTNTDDTNGVEADLGNMETTITASPTPTLKIHKDHLKKPKKIFDALQDPSWVEAMQEELFQFKIQNVWSLVDCPKGVRPIGTKWVLKNKKDERGIVIRNKARLVAQGHIQEEGIEYDEVFTLVARVEAIRRFLAYDSFMGFTVYQIDVKSSFLYDTIDEEVYGKDGTGKDVDLHLYRSMIRSLMYLTASRPDIMFVVCACARHQVTPKECHLHAVKRIFRYLKGHHKLGLWYPKESPFDLVAYSDSNYGGATQDRKSTTRGCQFLGRRLISWQCKKQTIVSTSTTEAEYVAVASCCGQVLWIQNQLLDYGLSMSCEALSKEISSSILLLGTIDQTLFIRRQRGDFILVQVYVDDIIFGSSNPQLCREFEALMHKKFQMSAMAFCDYHNMIAILEKYEHNQDFHQIVDFVKASHIRYALTFSPTVYVSHIREFWSTARIETTEEETKILAIVDGKLRTVSKSSIRRNLKLNDEAGISSLPNAKLFENLQLMRYNILPNQKFTFKKGQFFHQWKYLIHTIMQCLSPKSTGFNKFSSNIATALVCLATNRVYNFSKMIFEGMGEGLVTPTESHHTPTYKASQSSHHEISSPSLPPVPPESLPSVIPFDNPFLGKIPEELGLLTDQDRANIAKTSTLPSDSTPRVTSLAADEGSMQQKLNELTALCTSLQRQQSEMVSKFEAQELEINSLKARIKLLEDKDRGVADQSGDDAPIKGRRLDKGEEAAERVSDDTEEMATVLTSIDAASILTSGGIQVVPLLQKLPLLLKGKEKMVESDTPKKKKLQEQIDVQDGKQDTSGMTLEEIKEKFDLVWKQFQDFIPLGSKEEAERFKRKGLRLEKESVKKLKTSEEVKATEEVPKEKVKEMIRTKKLLEDHKAGRQLSQLPILCGYVEAFGQRRFEPIMGISKRNPQYQANHNRMRELVVKYKAEIVCYEEMVKMPLVDLKVLEVYTKSKEEHESHWKMNLELLKKEKCHVKLNKVEAERRGSFSEVVGTIWDACLDKERRDDGWSDLGVVITRTSTILESANVVVDSWSRKGGVKSRRVRDICRMIQAKVSKKMLVTNGQSERTFQTLENMFRACVRNLVVVGILTFREAEIGESKMIGLELEQETTNVFVIKERLKEAKDRQEIKT